MRERYQPETLHKFFQPQFRHSETKQPESVSDDENDSLELGLAVRSATYQPLAYEDQTQCRQYYLETLWPSRNLPHGDSPRFAHDLAAEALPKNTTEEGHD